MALGLAVAGCGAGDERRAVPPPPSPTIGLAAPVSATTTEPCRPAPLEARAAAVLVLGIGGATVPDAPLAARVAALGVGGVVLLGVNVVDARQVQALVEGLRERAPRRLLVAVDEEGGRVSRLRPIVGPTQ